MPQGQNRNVLLPGQMQNSVASSASNAALNLVNCSSRDNLTLRRKEIINRIYGWLQKKHPSKADDASKVKLFKLATWLEHEFLRTAKSKEDYWDLRTIEVRIDSTLERLSQRRTNPSSSVNATVQKPGALHGWGYTATPMRDMSTSNSSHNIPDATIKTGRLLPTNRINGGSIYTGYQEISPVSQMIHTPAVDNSANADVYQSHRIEENSRDGGRLMAVGSDFGSPSQLQRQCPASSNDGMLYNLDHQLGGGYISNIHQNTSGINSGVGMSSSNLHLANGPRSSEEVLSSTYFSTLYQPLQRPVNQLVSPMNRNSMCNSGTFRSGDLYGGLISPGSVETSVDMNLMSQNPMRGVDASFPSNQSSLQAVEKTPKSQLFRQFENGNFQSSSGSKENFAQVSQQPLEHQFKQQAHHGQSRQQEHLLNNDTYLQSQPVSNLVIQVKHQPHVEYYNEDFQMKVEPSNSQNEYKQNTFKNVYAGAQSPSVCSQLKDPPSLPSQTHQTQQISQLTDLINLSAGVQPVSGLGQWPFSSQNLAQISKNCNGGREQFGVRFPMKHEGTSNSSSVREPTNCKIVAARSTLEAPHFTEGSNTLTKQLNGDRGPNFINQGRWLLFVSHVRQCDAAKGNCESKYCFDGKMLLKHTDSCKSPACTYKYCLQTRKLIHHNKHCGNEACPVCVFVKNFVKNMKEKQKEKISLERTKPNSATLNHGPKESLEPMRASGESVSKAPFAVDDLQHPPKRLKAEIPSQFAFPATQSIPATMGLQEKDNLQRDVCKTVRSDTLQRTKPNSATLNHGHQESLECMRASNESVSEAPFVVDGLQPTLQRLKVEKPSQFSFPGTQSIPARITAGLSKAHLSMDLQEKDSLQRDVCKTVRSDVPMNADVSLQRTKPNLATLNHGHQESLECMRASSESVSEAPFVDDGLQPPLKRLKVEKPSESTFPGTQSIPARIATGLSKAHFSICVQEKDLQRDVCKTVRSDVPMNADSSDSSRRIVPVSNKLEKSVCKDTPMGRHSGESALDGETVCLPEQEKLKCMNEISSCKEENAEQSVGIVAASNSGHSKIEGVSLLELLTREQVEEHIRGLRQWVGQSKPKAEKNKAMGLSMSENSCQLCAVERLSFEPTPIYCTPCGRRVKRNVMLYTVVAGESRHYVCNSCYNEARENTVSVDGTSVPKSRLEKKKNDEEVEEPWVQCDKCQAWQHQICALFNGRRNHGQTEYTCPNCYIREVEQGKRKPISLGVIWGAKSLPASTLSNHLEQRLFKKLKQERQERARLQGKSYEEVPGADSLVIRVVASVDKILEVKPRFLDIFREDNYSSEFPYKSKTILLFQKIEGVDVCLFGMYVQEFGTDSASPNQRRVYLSYLDSVKYFRPDVKTESGEALRTFVYHEILIGYLDYCKKRGFTSCYIWACPPPKGEDYILYCHPEIQKTPKTVKLREWYLAMLKKASREKVVVECTNFYDHFFVQSGECKAKVTAARLPYFDGDYWPGAAEDMIDQMSEEEDSKKSNRKVTSKKVISKRALKAVRQSDLSVNASKDLLLMHKLGEMISPIKEDCIMVHLQHCCKHCCTLMVSGNRWVCKQCKNFQICDKCHEMEENRVEREKHPVNLKEKHVLYPIAIDDVPTEIKDDDDILESEFFNTRQAFLNLCQGNHYQYDTLRRAKHSSMMILYHLHNPSVPAFATTCAICQQELEIGQGWRCEVCPDYEVCNACYSNGINHPHSLISRPSATESVAQNTQTSQIQLAKLRDILLHVIACRTSQCQYPKCPQIRSLFKHGVACKTKNKDCILCTRVWGLLKMHARNCRDPHCKVPKCKELRAPLSRKQQQADSRRRAAVKEMVRQRATDAEASTSE